MSLVSCDPCWREEARFQQTSREWREWYTVVMSTIKDGPLDIYNALPALQVYAPHPQDGAALVAEWYPHDVDRSICTWLLELRYSTDVDVALNPLAIPAAVTLSTQIRELAAVFDTNGNPIMNAAGDLITDPPATRKIVDRVIQIEKNIPLILPPWVQTHPGCVNEDDVTIRGLTWPAGTLWFASLTIGPEQNVPGTTETVSSLRGTPYCVADYEWWYHPDGWVELFPNRGFFQLVYKKSVKIPAGNTEVPGEKPITAQALRAQWRKLPDYTKQKITVGPLGDYPPEPVFLDPFGRAILNPTFDDVITLQYDGYAKVSFNEVPIK